ncbi:hypothetical protein GOC53_19820 [Sinorhizobium medicae]|nr:hypothetical protein [Sinorhizobium meliloti]MDX0492506.1 hypothetical protein [Sinorhizobium medicae]
MLGGIKRFFSYVGSVLMRDTIPVWLSLVLMVLGAGATYWLAPKINAQFEVQAARREFLVKNLESFSSDTKSLIDVVSKSVNESSQFKYNSLVADLNPSIAKLQFAATQLLYIVPEHSREIVAFQRMLDQMQDNLLSFKAGGDPTTLLNASKSLMMQSLQIYEVLLAKAGFGDHISRPGTPAR